MVHCNHRFIELWDLPAELVPNRAMLDFERRLKIYNAAFDARHRFETEYRLKHYSGDYRSQSLWRTRRQLRCSLDLD